MDCGRDGFGHRMAEELAAVALDAMLFADERLRRGGPQTNDDFGANALEFRIEPRAAGDHFGKRGFLVDTPFAAQFGFEVFHGVGDIDLGARNPGFLEGTIEKVTRGPDEWTAGEVFFIARLLSHHHDSGSGRSFAKDGLRSVAVEVAPFAGLNGLL